MAKQANIIQLFDKEGNENYPKTSSAAIGMSDGSGNLDKKLKKVDENISQNSEKLAELAKYNEDSYAMTDDKSSNAYIKEFYTNDPAPEKLMLHFLQFTPADKKAQIQVKRGSDVNFASLLKIGTAESDIVYKLRSSNYDYYIVFNVNEKPISQVKDIAFTENITIISKNPTIEQYLLNPLIETKSVKYIVGDTQAILDANKCFQEFYIPDFLHRYGEGCYLERYITNDKQIRIWIKRSDGSFVTQINRDVCNEFYQSNAIIEIADNTTSEIIGYCILNKNVKAGSGAELSLNVDAIENIEYCPNIKEMLASDKQVILCGDSIEGQPSVNTLAEIMRAKLKCNVWNVACGGCQMSLRTVDGSNFYDKFSFTKIVDAIIANNFSEQDAALSVAKPPMNYKPQVTRMKLIDRTKEITFICNYSNNDLTNGAEVGRLWEYTDTISTHNKETFLGAQAYGSQKLLEAYPFWRLVFITDSYRYRKNAKGTLVPPYLYENSKGVTATEFTNKELENCERMGIRCYDFKKFGQRTAFNMADVTLDGTHNNPKGFYLFARYLSKIASFNV